MTYQHDLSTQLIDTTYQKEFIDTTNQHDLST